MRFNLPELCKIVEAHEPVAADALANTSDAICCKNIKKLWVVLQHYSAGGDTDLVLTWYEGTDVAFGTAAIITATSPIWYNVDTSLADALTRATDAATFTVDTGAAKNQIWVMEWDPALFSAGYDCFKLYSSGGDAANYVSVLYIAEMRYMSDVPPTVITD